MSDRRQSDNAADPQRVIREFLAAGTRAIGEERWSDATSTLGAALELCDRLPGTGALTLEVLEKLSATLQRTADPATAIPVQRRVVEMYEVLRKGDPRVSAAWASLGILCDEAGRTEEGKRYVARALALIEAGSDDDPVVIAQASAVGNVLLLQGEHLDGAERLLRKAIRGLAPIVGDEALEVADLEVALADVLMRTDRKDEVPGLLEAAIPPLEAEQPQRERFGLALMYLGTCRIEAEQLEEAEALFTRAESFFESTVGSDSAQALGARYQRALACREQGKAAEAESLLIEVLRDAQTVFGPTHAAVANIAESYADLLESLDRDEEAAALHAQAAAIRGADDSE